MSFDSRPRAIVGLGGRRAGASGLARKGSIGLATRCGFNAGGGPRRASPARRAGATGRAGLGSMGASAFIAFITPSTMGRVGTATTTRLVRRGPTGPSSATRGSGVVGLRALSGVKSAICGARGRSRRPLSVRVEARPILPLAPSSASGLRLGRGEELITQAR